MGLSYEFSVGSVRARENHLFDSSDIEQLLACSSVTELCKMLNDKGYGEGATIDEIIADHTAEMWKYLRGITPDFDIFTPFICQNDVHNFKAVLKGTLSGRDYENLMLTPCSTDIKVLAEAVKNRKFSLLPEWLSAAADEAYDILAHTGDARLSDAVTDKAAMEKMLAEAKRYKSEFLKNYFNNLIFYGNIKIALRSAKTDSGMDYLLKALCDVEDFRKSTVINAALKGIDNLIDVLSKFPEYDCQKAISEYKRSPSAFEKFVDNRLIALAKESCKRASEGAQPLLGYYLGCEAEKKVIHIIASGIKTDCDKETIRERLRDIYG